MTDSVSVDQLARAFIERFAAGDVGGLARLLAADFRLVGPLGRFGSREEYLAALRRDPPRHSRVEIRSLVCDERGALALYEIAKGDSAVAVAQSFEASGPLLTRSLVAFRPVAGPDVPPPEAADPDRGDVS